MSAELVLQSEMLQAEVGCGPFSLPIYMLLLTPVIYPGPSDTVRAGG